METIDELRAEMNALVRKNFKLFREVKEFIPGETPIPISGKVVDNEEVNQLLGAVMDMWWTDGSYTSRFEARLKKYLKMRHAAFCNSGSSANLLAVAAAKEYFGWKNGDKIVTSACGFPTTLNAILQNGLIPVFVDVELPYYVPNTSTIIWAIHQHDAKAVFMAHTLGNPFDVKAISEYVPVLEDNCDALGSKINDRLTGTLGVVATQSFYPAHHITSLDAKEWVLLRSPSGDVIWRMIGDFVNSESHEGWECVAFDKDGKLAFRPITGTVKHICEEPLIRATLQTGRTAVVSASHSLFKMGDEGPETIRADSIAINDLILAPRVLPSKRIIDVDIDYTEYARGSWKPIARKLRLDKRIARILGWFVAEGSLYYAQKAGNYNYFFALGPDELDIAKNLKDDLAEAFGVKSKIYKRVSGWSLQGSRKALFEFLKAQCSTGARRKRVPPIIFDCSAEIQKEFLEAYLNGDGHFRNQRGEHESWSVKTASEELAHGIHSLLLQMELAPRFYEGFSTEHELNGQTIPRRKYFNVSYGTSGKGITNALSFRGEQGKNKKLRRYGDLTLLKVRKIEYVEPSSEYVYDLAVEGYENFIAGRGMIVHNTGEGGMVLTRHPKIDKIVRSLRDWGRSCWCPTGHENTCGKRFEWDFPCLPQGFDHKYVYSRIGYNMKGTDLNAAIGVAQLKKLEWFVARRKENHDRIYGGLKAEGMEEFFILPEPYPNSDPSWFGFLLTVKDSMPFTRNALTRELNLRKVGTRNLFGGNLLKQPAYAGLNAPSLGNLESSDKIARDTLWVGCYPGITDEMCDYMVETIANYAKGAERLRASKIELLWE